jgi:hypothetical protein
MVSTLETCNDIDVTFKQSTYYNFLTTVCEQKFVRSKDLVVSFILCNSNSGLNYYGSGLSSRRSGKESSVLFFFKDFLFHNKNTKNGISHDNRSKFYCSHIISHGTQ